MGSRAGGLEPAEIEKVEAILQRAAGICLSKALRRALQESFAKAAEACGLAPQAFLARLEADDAECISMLVEHSVIGETYFFRHPEQFAAFKRRLHNDFHEEKSIAVWSAGCATGEEPYSLAMTLLEMRGAGRSDKVIATDISERSLRCAREGRYGAWSLRRLDPSLHRRLFERVGANEVRVTEEARGLVQFRRHNLISDPPAVSGCHAIFCRNVLIYFPPQTALHVLRKFVEALRPGGLLVLGPVEVPMATNLDLEWVDCDGATILRRPVPGERKHASPARPIPAPLRKVSPRRATPVHPQPARAITPVAVASVGEAIAPIGVLFERARDAARSGRLEEAERLALDSAKTELMPESYLLLSYAAESRGDLGEAVEAVRKALYLEPNLAVGHAALVPLFHALGRRQDAERSRRNALRVLEGLEESAILQGVEEITAGALRRALELAGREGGGDAGRCREVLR